MDETSTSGRDNHFETRQMSQSARASENLPRTPRWSDYEDDPNWVPESFEFITSSSHVITSNAELKSPPREPISTNEQACSGPTDTLERTSGKALLNEQEQSVHCSPAFGVRLEQAQPGMNESGKTDNDVSRVPPNCRLTTDFHHLNRGESDNEDEVHSTWSSSSSDSDDSPTEALSDLTDATSESTASSPTPEPPVPCATAPPRPTRRTLQPSSPSLPETGGTTANLAAVVPPTGPFRPPAGSDFPQLAAAAAQAARGWGAALNGAQAGLLRRLGSVQDRGRRARERGGADAFRRAVWAREDTGRPALASPFGPAWDRPEERMRREMGRRFQAEFELGRAAEREREMVEALELVAFRIENASGDLEAKIVYSEFHGKVKEKELDLVKKEVVKRVTEFKEKAKADKKELELQLEHVTSLNVMLEDQVQSLSAKNEKLSNQRQELEAERATWFEIFDFWGTSRERRRKSDGEILTDRQKIETLNVRLQTCSEKLKEETRSKLQLQDSYNVLDRELSTEKCDTADLLLEAHKLSDELQESKVLIERKENELRSLAAGMNRLAEEKEELSRNLRTIKITFAGWIETDSPIDYISSFFERAELDSAREIAAIFEAENVVLRNTLAAINRKVGHLISPQDVQAIERQYQEQIDSLVNDMVRLQSREKALRNQYEEEVQKNSLRLREAQSVASEAQARNEPLLKQIENLATQVGALEKKLELEKRKAEKLEEKLDPHHHSSFTSAECSRHERNGMLMYYNEQAELLKQVEVLGQKIKELATQTTVDAKRIRQQKERIRGLEDDLIGIRQSQNRSLDAVEEPRKVFKRCGIDKYDEDVQAVVRKQIDIDNEKWAKRAERWEKLLGITIHTNEHGEIRLEASPAFWGRSQQGLLRDKDMLCIEKSEETERKRGEAREEFQRVHQEVTMRLRGSGWR